MVHWKSGLSFNQDQDNMTNSGRLTTFRIALHRRFAQQHLSHRLLPSLFGLLCCLGVVGQEEGPIDKKATRETVSLYRHLKTLREKGFLFGHQDDLAYGVGWKYVPGNSDIKAVTGQYPGIYGWELGRLELDHAVNIDSVPFDSIKTYIRQGYERGGVITVSWHLNNPLTGGTAWQPAPGTMASILPGGSKNGLYQQWLDRVAAFLQDLKGPKGEAIPVVLRLFHELNGDWFWWGGKNSSGEELKALWRFTIGYLRDTKNLHNLLYAYNTDRFASEAAYLDKYPGDEWIDILGFDIYQGNTIKKNTDFLAEFDKTLGLMESIAEKRNKIPALTEFGFDGIPDSTWWTQVFGKAMAVHHMAYAVAWRNAGSGKHDAGGFYVPYPGQLSANDFLTFSRHPHTLLQQAAAAAALYR